MAGDKIDQLIIQMLKANGRATTASIARAIGVPEPTVRRKLNRILESGTIRIVAVTSPKEAGLHVPAFIGFEMERPNIEEMAKHLTTYENIETVSVVTGASHIMARGYFKTTDDLYDFVLHKVGAVPGVRNTRSNLVLRDFKTYWGAGEGMLADAHEAQAPPGKKR